MREEKKRLTAIQKPNHSKIFRVRLRKIALQPDHSERISLNCNASRSAYLALTRFATQSVDVDANDGSEYVRNLLIPDIFHLLKPLMFQLADLESPNISSVADSSPLLPQDENRASRRIGSPNRRPSRFRSKSASFHLL